MTTENSATESRSVLDARRYLTTRALVRVVPQLSVPLDRLSAALPSLPDDSDASAAVSRILDDCDGLRSALDACVTALDVVPPALAEDCASVDGYVTAALDMLGLSANTPDLDLAVSVCLAGREPVTA